MCVYIGSLQYKNLCVKGSSAMQDYRNVIPKCQERHGKRWFSYKHVPRMITTYYIHRNFIISFDSSAAVSVIHNNLMLKKYNTLKINA